MKSTLLKTLAATSLVASSHAAVHVLGTTFKERPVDASTGVIVTNQPAMITTRGYLIIDDTALGTVAPTPATYIEYWEERAGNVISRFYTVDTDFTNFRADSIMYNAYSPRLYGFMRVPVQMAEVTNPKISFTGAVLASGFPKSLSFDSTVYQSGASDSIVGPKILTTNPSTLRSTISGNANIVKVSETTIADVTDELIARLTSNPNKEHIRVAGEAPEIITDLSTTPVELQDGQQVTLTIAVDPDVFPTGTDTFEGPTFKWFKNDVVIPGAVTTSLVVTGAEAATGPGNYKVEVSNELGSDISNVAVFTAKLNSFGTNLPPTLTIPGATSSVLSVTIVPTPVVPPEYQWFKNNVAIPVADGGKGATLTVTGGAAATSAGTYRVEVKNSASTIVSGNCVVTISNVVMSFTTNLTTPVPVPFGGSAVLAPVINADAFPKPATYRWSRSATVGGTYAPIADGDGGALPTLTVYGDASKPTGSGFFYRLTVTNSLTPTPQTLISNSAQVTVAPAP